MLIRVVCFWLSSASAVQLCLQLRLLSVQVSQTPGLYVGSGVYPGPGLYQNMSSLCYFIQKSRQLSCLLGTSILFIFTLKHCILRRCKRGLQSLLSLKKYSYKDHLIHLHLSTLKYRRLRWDMIEVFKIVKQKYDTTILPEISVISSSVIREGTTINY